MGDMREYADMGPNVSRIVADGTHEVWRAEGSDGQGIMTMYHLMPGVMVMFNDYASIDGMESSFRLAPGVRMLFLNYCREGRIEWRPSEDTSLYLGVGDLGIDDHRSHAGHFAFPLGLYRGISVSLDPERADESLATALEGGLPVSVSTLYDAWCADDEPRILRGNPSVGRIFSGMYEAEGRFCETTLRLLVMELLLLLGEEGVHEEASHGGYVPRPQVEKVRALERAITSDLAAHHTLRELAERFGLPYASMQRLFREVYGTSIHAYLTRYRMSRAAALLRTTELPVGDIALQVGYASASKFSRAFREATGATPSDYRHSVLRER